MIPPHSIKKFAGLVASSNTVAAAEGGADIMDNCVLRTKDVIEPRRGYWNTAPGNAANAIAFKDGYCLMLSYVSQQLAASLLRGTPWYTGDLPGVGQGVTLLSQAWPAINGYMPLGPPGIAGASTRYVGAQKALYFQSTYGLLKIESMPATFTYRVALRAPPITDQNPGALTRTTEYGTIAAVVSSTNNWLTTGNQVAYRFTVCRLGANNELIESEPSERLILANAAGANRAVTLTMTGLWMLQKDAFIRIYRSKQVATGTDPTDELFLIAEVLPNSTVNFSDGYLTPTGTATYTDQTSDTSLTVPLYTNPYSGSGIAAANAQPPLAADMAWFKSRMHYFNTVDVQRVAIGVIGTGSGGISDGDYVAINGVRFTFRSTPVGATDVKLFTAGSVAANLENTARELTYQINAYYLSQPPLGATPSDELPWTRIFASYLSLTATDAGRILLRSLTPGAQAFTVTTSSRNGWDRDYTGGKTSDPNAQIAGWSWSAVGQPECVPTANNNPIGDPSAAGYRMIALREAIFAFKADGLWKITDDGSALGPQLQLVDPTIKLIAPQSAVALDNFIFCLCDQGVVLITETGGVVNITHPSIERELLKLIGNGGLSTLSSLAFGVAYQPEHTYILSLPESPNASSCMVQYVYNLQSGAWTRWRIPNTLSAAVSDTGQLFWGLTSGILIERKAGDASDYQDPGWAITSPTGAATATMVFTGDQRSSTPLIGTSQSFTTGFAVGDLVQQYQASNALSQSVIAVSYSSAANQTTITLDAAPRYPWIIDGFNQLRVVKAIQSSVRLLPLTAGEPLVDKNWGDCFLSFRYCDLGFVSVGWASEKYPLTSATNPYQERVNNADGTSTAPITLRTWAPSPWGSTVWGRQTRDVIMKCTLPQDVAMSSQLTLSLAMPCALSRFELNAIDIKIAGATDRIVR